MAKRRKSTTTTRVVTVPAVRQASPIIRVQAPRAAPVKRKRSRRRSSRSTVGGMLRSSALDVGLGGFLYGMLVKQGIIDKLPAIPVIGRTGTAAIILDYWARRGGGEWVRKGATAAAVIAGYQLGSTGSITGDEHLQTAGFGDASPDDYYPDGYDYTDQEVYEQG